MSRIIRQKEFFQSAVGANNASGGSSINDAYSAGSSVKNLITEVKAPVAASNSKTSADVANEGSTDGPQGAGSGIGNLWNFIGLDKLSLKQKQCSYNCGIDILGCMERCANPDCLAQENLHKEQCRYGCIRKGISCSTNCISHIEPEHQEPAMFNSDMVSEPVMTLPTSSAVITSRASLTTTSVCGPQYDIPPSEVHGSYQNMDGYAPYDMRVWPQQGQYGWTLGELNRMKRNGYEVPNVIEVNMDHSLYPIKSDKPVLQFDLAKSYRQISGEVE